MAGFKLERSPTSLKSPIQVWRSMDQARMAAFKLVSKGLMLEGPDSSLEGVASSLKSAVQA
jgi:hypothetical protein